MTSGCPGCRGMTAEPFFESAVKDFSLPGYRYLRCTICGTVFNDDCPPQEELTRLHREQWYSPTAFRYPDAGKDDLVRRWTKIMAEADEAVRARTAGVPRHLDIGCGYGFCCEALRRMGYHSTGIDPSPDSIDAAKREFPENEFFAGSLTDEGLPQLHGVWDLVTMNDVLEHVVSPDLLMHEVHRVTATGAIVYVQVPSAGSLQLEYLRQHAFHSMAPFHRTLFSVEGLSRLLDRNGFDLLTVLPSHINWGWTRALSFQLGIPDDYARLRDDEAFRRLDLAIDTLFDRIAIDMRRAPSLRILCLHRATH
jgi:SAM-dependent methyltransferase